MPPGAGGSLPDQTYINLAAFILDANGARPGNDALTPASAVAIRSVASGHAPAYRNRRSAACRPAGETDKQAKQGKQAPRGLTVTGEVKNYVPVTDANLRNPDPADWLMIRHDYKRITTAR